MVTTFNKQSVTENEWILIRTGSYQQEIKIHLKNWNILGRGQNKGVRYSIGVSRKHALLKKTVNEQWEIMDLVSTNGLFINGTKVPAHCLQPIQEFDIIGLGVANALREEHFSFMLCRISKQEQQYDIVVRPNVKEFLEQDSILPERCTVGQTEMSLCELDGNKINVKISQRSQIKNDNVILKDATSGSSNRDFSNRNSDKLIRNNQSLVNSQQENEDNINLKDFNKRKNPANVLNISTKTAIEKEDAYSLFEKHKRKWNAIPLNIISDDKDDDMQTLPKRSKLHKSHMFFSSEESDYTSDEILLKNIVPAKTDNNYEADVINSFSGIERENIQKYHDSYERKLIGHQYSQFEIMSPRCAQSDQQSTNNPTDRAVSLLQRPRMEQVPMLSHGFQTDNLISDENLNEHRTILRLYSDTDVTMQDEEEFLYDDHIYDGNIKDSILNGDEVPVCDTVDDGFDFGITEEELLNRIVWPPKPDDCYEENIPLQYSETYFHIGNEEGRKSQYTESKPKKISPVQISNKYDSIKLTDALPMKTHNVRKDPMLKEKRKNMEYSVHSPSKQIKISSVINDAKHYRSRQWSTSINKTVKKLPGVSNYIRDFAKPKVTTNKPLVPRFQSRTELLLMSMLY